MSLNLAADGCILPNIHTKDYRITFLGECGHTKIQQAVIVISATDEQAARQFAETWIRQGVMRRTVVTEVEVA